MKFQIKKGDHYSNCWLYKAYNMLYKPLLVNGDKELTNKIKFSQECVYKGLEDDVNKLFGFNISNIKGNLFEDVHEHSVRFGWRPNLNGMYIDIFSYYYINGVRKYVRICSVIPEKFYKYKIGVYKINDIDVVEYQYRFEVTSLSNNIVIGDYKSDKFKMVDNNKFNLLISTNNYPYFGGNIVAPQDMTITIIS
jgi:hypothetical protein